MARPARRSNQNRTRSTTDPRVVRTEGRSRRFDDPRECRGGQDQARFPRSLQQSTGLLANVLPARSSASALGVGHQHPGAGDKELAPCQRFAAGVVDERGGVTQGPVEIAERQGDVDAVAVEVEDIVAGAPRGQGLLALGQCAGPGDRRNKGGQRGRRYGSRTVREPSTRNLR